YQSDCRPSDGSSVAGEFVGGRWVDELFMPTEPTVVVGPPEETSFRQGEPEPWKYVTEPE
ncbi:hypothetical protein, partial [Schaalia suimastitidis]|uniref:hypothetical protein n=1 Tax=Schaalia suimastitidis TaxID=121163 RepID=UPI00196A172C